MGKFQILTMNETNLYNLLYYVYIQQCWLIYHVCFREEIQSLSKENEIQEVQIRSGEEKLKEEIQAREKLEKILQDAAGALRVALRVGYY